MCIRIAAAEPRTRYHGVAEQRRDCDGMQHADKMKRARKYVQLLIVATSASSGDDPDPVVTNGRPSPTLVGEDRLMPTSTINAIMIKRWKVSDAFFVPRALVVLDAEEAKVEREKLGEHE